jgi:hypothetical protein
MRDKQGKKKKKKKNDEDNFSDFGFISIGRV